MGFIGLFECASAEQAHTNAPTGVYVSLSDIPAQFTVELKTNGVYSVFATGIRTNSQTGVWRWDALRRQFSLTPSTNGGTFDYQFRVLRVDQREPEILQWIPLGRSGQASGGGISQASGTIDYVRFKRKGE